MKQKRTRLANATGLCAGRWLVVSMLALIPGCFALGCDGEPGGAGECEQDAQCDDGDPCNGEEICDPVASVCSAGTPPEEGTVCAESPRSICLHQRCVESTCGDGFVDVGLGERCDPPGEDGCTSDCVFACENDADCPDDGEPCNGEEYCVPDVHSCGHRNSLADGTECGSSPRRICLGEVCRESVCGDGYPDGAANPSEECDDGNDDPDDGCEADCTFSCHENGDCDDGHDCTGDLCNTAGHTCQHSLMPSGTLCRDATGDCDAAEYCTGGDADCPADSLLDAATVCRPAVDLCDAEETCTGMEAACPVDKLAPPTLECRPAAGDCDVAEFCTGSSTACPTDQFKPNTLECRPAVGDCDVAETCPGTGPTCPGDTLVPDMTVCRPATGECDIEETCTSFDPGCPLDQFMASGTPCNDADSCSTNDSCDGAGHCLGTPRYDFLSLSAGYEHVCAVMLGGGVTCWGAGGGGQLGNGASADQLSPVATQGLPSAVAEVSAGGYHSCAVVDTGALHCWGLNDFGQLGDGSGGNQNTAQPVVGLDSGVLHVSAGLNYTCAVLGDGGVRCWGFNEHGKLGDGTTTNRSLPVAVMGLSSKAIQVSANVGHTCAVLDTGGIMCWGRNANGQLGDGTTTDSSTPVAVQGLASAAVAVYTATHHTCALLDTGGVQCWGWNHWGQCGDGTPTQRTTPVFTNGLTGGVAQLSAAYDHACVVLDDGAVSCWGWNLEGSCGNGSVAALYTPTAIYGQEVQGVAVSAGGAFSCALMATGSVICWGDNDFGQLSDGWRNILPYPVLGGGLDGGVSTMNCEGNHTCAVVSGGLKCFGDNDFAQLGDGTFNLPQVPVEVVGLSSGVTAVSTGLNNTCAITSAGGLKCWGSNMNRQVGDGTGDLRSTPTDVLGLASGVSMSCNGSGHTCALTSAGGVKCWGDNGDGECGLGFEGPSVDTPADVVGLTAGVVEIACGSKHTCALLNTGAVKCWGWNTWGTLGDGTTTGRSSPVDVLGLQSGVTSISAGSIHSCAVQDGGAVCWGSGNGYVLGNGWPPTSQYTPAPVASLTSGVQSIGCGYLHTCALLTSDEVACWGTNSSGQVGGGAGGEAQTPVVVPGVPAGVRLLSVGMAHNCVVTDAGALWCWGSNHLGRISAFFSGYPHFMVCD